MLVNPRGISHFKIEKRVLEPVTRFDMVLKSKGNPSNLKTGLKLMFQLEDLYGSTNPALFTGRIDKIRRVINVNNSDYTIEGRDNGLFLAEQPIVFPCKNVLTDKDRTRTFLELLGRIVRGTGIRIPPEMQVFKQDFTNKIEDQNHFCGEFRSKKDAIDYLLMRYGELNELPKHWYRWYVDINSYLRVFNAYAMNRPTAEFYSTNSRVEEIVFEEVADRVRNDITVIGGSENQFRKRLLNEESIKRYGRRVAEPISDSYLTTQTEVNKRAEDELKYRSEEIIVGHMNMLGFPSAECGLALNFPGDPRYSENVFIVTSVTHEGSPGNYKTNISFSTDENVIVNPNLTDIIHQMIENLKEVNCPVIGEVVGVNPSEKTIDVRPIGLLSSSIVKKQNTAIAKGGVLKAYYLG